MNGKGNHFTIRVPASDAGRRLDSVVSDHVADLSRSVANRLIREAVVRVGARAAKPGYRVRPGDEICGRVPPPEMLDCRPEPIPTDILFEDAHLIVVDKAPGCVVHPAPGNASGTLVNALLHHCPDLGRIGSVIRPGIVHRLDKDTSGTLIVAKTAVAHQRLSEQFKSRTIRKTYLALVCGQPADSTGAVDLPIGRHPVDRKRMSTVSRRSRDALTLWRITERLPGATLLEVEIKTGRTHQIRVHMAAIGHPVVGDAVYGRGHGRKLPPASRQMLHAWKLAFDHPVSGRPMHVSSPVPADLTRMIEALKRTDASR